MPKPSVSPWTVPNATLTAAMPAAMPVSTGSSPSASVRGERYSVSSSATISTMLAVDSRSTSCRIVSRVSTENTPGPVIASMYAAGFGSVCVAAENARRTASIARACASVSEPAAAVCTTSTARVPSRDAHTPSRTAGCAPLSSRSTSAVTSPVGSRGSIAFATRPADEPSRSRLSPSAWCRPSALKRRGVTAGLSR
ncbi:hypothetical protein BamIOP4010DRAFT_5944 [Burkholderia ambifaria IOP40-10]|uniref:Uncharacterized protein n=1 Tax=Burkholderia ambifaria IOP40-10 TaxID=396596 RepID=B1FPI3_9BURK|nr:hypothetical protein BamIOP4010DRAFT_5944 [Burkholderia ambifaria IOP40-10]